MIINMANLQRIVISLLLIVTAGFLFLAQTSSAAKGPKITNKVNPLAAASFSPTCLLNHCRRSTLISPMEMRHWAES